MFLSHVYCETVAVNAPASMVEAFFEAMHQHWPFVWLP